jgi:hypothetical protein
MSVKDPNPLNRPDVWSLSASGTTVPAAFHYVGGAQKQITNSAGDAITGLKRRQGEITMTVRGNRSGSPFALATTLVNRTNATEWADGAERTWLCTSISAQQQSELVGNEIVDYWSVSFSFAYRPETWAVQAPDVGLNQIVYIADQDIIVGREKRRITIQDANGNAVPTPKPLPLNSDGTLKGATAEADFLTFSVYQTADFLSYFGDPPT